VDWQETIFDYCERRDSGLWGEPLNALTNAAFLVAAAAAFVTWRRRSDDPPTFVLVIVTAAVGAGSFLFHTFATRAAMWLDVIPIAAFIYTYFFLALRRFFQLGPAAAVGATLFFALGSQFIGDRARGLNGSIAYLPALGALILFSALLWMRSGRSLSAETDSARTASRFALATAVFAVSLFFRTIDRSICTQVPPGTHFIWHLLNALTLWLLLRTLMLQETDQRAQEPPDLRFRQEEKSLRS
jgi:hypothetical protein